MAGRKKGLIYAVLLVAVGAALRWFGKGFAASNMPLPGSEGDPLVTKAYVDSYVNSRLKMSVVELASGQTLIGYSGTEIILRGGQATVIDSELGGLCDVTQGVDLGGGSAVPANHLLLVPRDDGRGIKATSDAIVMVRGEFTIK
ncbi:MAG: hypothetical protein ACOX35_05120 [Bacillota bacterium]|jgi:hypothetical protein|nr:hypothetical protein [Candidatus Fermentithermobacillaceae bacterium]